MMQYVYDFLSVFFDKLKEKEKLTSIILFGSNARGNARKDSDIDIFIDTKNRDEISPIVKESLNEFEDKASKTWHLKGIKNVIAPIVDNLRSDQWKELRKEIAVYGVMLYGRYAEKKPLSAKHCALIKYNISKLKQHDKMNVIRALSGYKLKKGKKIYNKQGILQDFNAEKITNAIIVNIKNYPDIIKLFKENKVPISIRSVWLE